MTIDIDTIDLVGRFLRYVQIDTRSDDESSSMPSTGGQWDLLRLLVRELREIGLVDVKLTEHGYVLATVPATVIERMPVIAWFAHVDTATNLPGAANPIVHHAFDGQPIVLPDNASEVLTVETTPFLRGAIGHDVITASGTTLLGADDKAGIACIMSAVQYLVKNPHIRHGGIRICFNPDEEIGRGMSKLDLAELGADFGYTIDGATPGEIDSETFSGDSALLEICGIGSHPGWARDAMVNAMRLAGRFLAALPLESSPERTCGTTGFIHPIGCTASPERAVVRLLLRDFELDGLAEKRNLLNKIVAELAVSEPRARFELNFKEQYRNMRYWIEKDVRPVKSAAEAIRRAGLDPKCTAVRGGTDGSVLTQRGLLTPNIFCGMHEIHSLREWVSAQDMAKAAEVLIHLATIWAEHPV